MAKKVLSVILCLFIAASMTSVPALAANQGIIGIQPLWSNVSTVSLGLNYSNSTANWTGAILGQPGTTKITATYTLSLKNANGTYTALKSWSDSTNSDLLYSSGSYSTVSSGNTYRISVTANVTRNGSIETVTDSFEKKY